MLDAGAGWQEGSDFCNIYSDSRILLSVLYTILIQMEIPLYHLKIKARIVLNGMKIKEFYVLCVDICN